MIVELCSVELMFLRRRSIGVEILESSFSLNSAKVGRDELIAFNDERMDDGTVTLESELRDGTSIEGGVRRTLSHSIVSSVAPNATE